MREDGRVRCNRVCPGCSGLAGGGRDVAREGRSAHLEEAVHVVPLPDLGELLHLLQVDGVLGRCRGIAGFGTVIFARVTAKGIVAMWNLNSPFV